MKFAFATPKPVNKLLLSDDELSTGSPMQVIKEKKLLKVLLLVVKESY